MNVKAFLPIITTILFAFRAGAQAPVADTLMYSGEMKVIDAFNKNIGEQSAYYNGEEYNPPVAGVKGSPFFLGTMSMQPSQIRYNGFWYKNVPVFYDLLNDVMVSAARSVLYSVRNGNLSDVILAGHHFVYLGPQQSANLDPGYYDRLYDGPSEVLVKRSCSVVSHAGDRTVEVYYENRDAIYIKKSGRYTQVSSKGSVLALFKDRGKQLKQYVSTNGIDYGKDKEGAVVKLAAYYDQPNN